ncbi:MAG: hypothetical protein K1X92_01055 [Bacteroidia bacterium]|nr:hypothetical protein [Bacteroidia bacterium]
MNIKSLIFFLFFWCVILPEYSEGKPFPDYPTVLNRLLKNYTLKSVEYEAGGTQYTINTLAKKTDGWYWVQTVFKEGEEKIPVRTVSNLFWSAKSRSFLELKAPGNTTGVKNNEDYREFLLNTNEYERMYYRISPCYGYTGWEKDLIYLYKDKTSLPDSALYMLGRAYSFYSGNLILDYSSPVAADYRFILPEGLNCLSPAQLAEYRKYHHATIRTFERLEKQNPKFETIIGNISVKTANEHITAFLYLCMVQNEAEAMKELANVRYPEEILKISRNYMNSCRQDAVLITNGDNDTFPLLYLQAKEHFRTDITVINISLLNTNRYIEMLRNQQYAQALMFSASPEEVKSIEDYIPLKVTEDTVSVSSVLKSIYKGNIESIASGTLYLPSEEYPDLYWAPTDKSYWLKADMMLMDILQANAWKRPVYFCQTVSPSSFCGLDDFFCTEGLAFRINPGSENQKEEVTGLSLYTFNNKDVRKICNPEAQREMLFEQFVYPSVYSSSESTVNAYSSIRLNYIYLAMNYLSNSDSAGVLKILDRCMGLFQDEYFPGDYPSLIIAELYYRTGETDKANTLVSQVYKNIKTNRLKPESIHTSILNLMERLTDGYGQEAFLEQLKNTH